MPDRSPDFLCIGAQKAGTTWLNANLRNHPNAWLPPLKEVHYFDQLYIPASRKWIEKFRYLHAGQAIKAHMNRGTKPNWDPAFIAGMADMMAADVSDEWYRRIFSLAAADQICGEITPEYSLLPREGIEHALRLAPELKIILSMRDPISRSWSHMRMLAANAGITDATKMGRFARYEGVVNRSDYPAILARWKAFVPSERLLTISMDDIAARPVELMQKVCDFFGIPFSAEQLPNLDKPVFEGKSLPIPDGILARLKTDTLPIYEAMATEFPELTEKWMQRYFN